MSRETEPKDVSEQLRALEERLREQLETLHHRIEAQDLRTEQRFGEVRARQDENIVLVKAMSCQLRGRVERVERRAGRGVG